MAFLHFAGIRPTKLELLQDWLPTQPWYVGGADPELQQLGSYRFDDPDGEVGIETLIVRDGDGPTFQVPMTYRAAPLDVLGAALVGTLAHTVLGRRWVYDGCTDPVYAAALATTILNGGAQADLVREKDGRMETVDPTVLVRGSGDSTAEIGPVELVSTRHADEGTVIETSVADLVVIRDLDSGSGVAGDQTLAGTWEGVTDPVVLAVTRLP